jgi:hypothetical protein
MLARGSVFIFVINSVCENNPKSESSDLYSKKKREMFDIKGRGAGLRI